MHAVYNCVFVCVFERERERAQRGIEQEKSNDLNVTLVKTRKKLLQRRKRNQNYCRYCSP
jgi:hypothetical protein